MARQPWPGVRRVVPTVLLLGVSLSACGTPSEPQEPTPTPTVEPEPVLEEEVVLEEVVTVPATVATSYGVSAGVLAVAWPGESTPEEGRLAGYRLSDGAQSWVSPLFADDVGGVLGVGSMFVAATFEHVTCPDEVDLDPCRTPWTSVYDAETGSLLWREPGYPQGVTSDSAIVVTTELDDPYASLTDLHHTGRRADNGEVVWTYTVHEEEFETERWGVRMRNPAAAGIRDGASAAQPVGLSETAALQWLVVARRSGTAVVVDPRTGQTRELEVGTDSADPPHPVSIAGDLLVTQEGDDFVAYDLVSLRERWRRPRQAWAVACGALVCLASADAEGRGEIQGVDALTGELRWSRSTEHVPVPTPALPASAGSPVLDYPYWRLRGAPGEPAQLAAHCDPPPAQDSLCFFTRESPVVLSAENGEVLLDLVEWHLVGASGSWLVLLRGPDGPAALYDAQLTFAVADMEDLSVHEVGTLPALHQRPPNAVETITSGCRVLDDWMTCRHTDDTITAWRIRTTGQPSE